MSGRAPLAAADELLRFAAEYDLAVPDYFLTIGLAAASARLKEAMCLKGLTLAGAESVTGGSIAARLTDPPGASAYFLGAAVTYSVASKLALLGVPRALVEREGVVSAEVAKAMAERAARLFGADLAYATTGFAGPSGGADGEPPVGTVFVGFAFGDSTFAWPCAFGNASRDGVRRLATEFTVRALLLLALGARGDNVRGGA